MAQEYKNATGCYPELRSCGKTNINLALELTQASGALNTSSKGGLHLEHFCLGRYHDVMVH